jgi:hypothetical protein
MSTGRDIIRNGEARRKRKKTKMMMMGAQSRKGKATGLNGRSTRRYPDKERQRSHERRSPEPLHEC